jgi:4-amino-4-deoxy-L-arabinose transferase-like glycosyltransferase
VWVVPAALAAPDYLADFVWVHNVERYLWSSSAENLFHPEPLWFFVPVVLVALLPWSPLLPVTVAASLQERGGDRLLAEYVVWVLVFFSLSSGKLATYVVPAFPAAAILTARWLVERRIDDRLAGRTLARVGAGLTAPLVIAAAVAIHDRAPSATFHAASLLPASAAGLVVAIAGRRFTTTVAAVTVVSWGLVATLFVFSVWSAPALSAHMSDRDLAHAARAAGPADAVVAYRVRPFSFLFYYRERLVYYVPVDEYRQALFTPGRVLVLTEDRWRPHLEAIAPGVELREIARNSIHVLYGADNP